MRLLKRSIWDDTDDEELEVRYNFRKEILEEERMNSTYLTGNLGRDASFKELEDGKKVTIFSMATTEKSKDKEFTTWHRIICWGVAAEISKHYKKGDRIFVQGSIRNRNFDKDGETRQITEINAFTVNKLEKFIKPVPPIAQTNTPPRIEEIPF